MTEINTPTLEANKTYTFSVEGQYAVSAKIIGGSKCEITYSMNGVRGEVRLVDNEALYLSIVKQARRMGNLAEAVATYLNR